MKFATSEFLPNVDRIDTDPPGPYWLMLDRTLPNWEMSLRGPKVGVTDKVQFATFNPHACHGLDIEQKILWLLNTDALKSGK